MQGRCKLEKLVSPGGFALKSTALLVIDVQNAMMYDKPYKSGLLITNIKKLLQLAKDNSFPIIYIRHDGGIGNGLEKGIDSWQIYDEIAPSRNEMIFDKQFNSAFKETKLHDYLKSINIQKLILTGMQTEYCIDATCKSAFDLGYEIIIVKSSVTTYDNSLITAETITEFYEEQVWQGRFASVIPIECLSSELSK